MSLAKSADEQKYLLMRIQRISGLPYPRILFYFFLPKDRWDKEFSKLETALLETSFELDIVSLIWVLILVFSRPKIIYCQT